MANHKPLPKPKDTLKPFPQSDLTGIPLLRECWDRAKADRSAWKQDNWLSGAELSANVIAYIEEHRTVPWNCGTTACVAGHIVLSKGANLVEMALWDVRHLRCFSAAVVYDDTGNLCDVGELAAELIGLDEAQAELLFAGENDADLVEAYVTALEGDPAADLYDVVEHHDHARYSEVYDDCRYCVTGEDDAVRDDA